MAHDHHAAADTHHAGTGEYGATPPGAGHEHTDASVGIIVKFGLWLAIAAVVIHVGVWGLFALFVQFRSQDELDFPIAAGTERRLPSGARLQQFPVVEMYQFRLQEREALETYGWADRAAGHVRIPIREAMRLTLERGLPARAEAPEAEAAAAPGLLPSDASSGRTMERRRQ